MNMYNLGAKIKQLRLSRQYTQQTLADYLDVTKSMVSAYENGTRYPSYPVLVKIACLFRVTTDYLLDCPSHGQFIDVTGLTDNEVDGILHLIEALKRDR